MAISLRDWLTVFVACVATVSGCASRLDSRTAHLASAPAASRVAVDAADTGAAKGENLPSDVPEAAESVDAGPAGDASLPAEPLALPAEGCHPVSAKLLDAIERDLRKSYERTRQPSRVLVDFRCDTLADTVREIRLEEASGHGGTLRLIRLVREGAVFSARRYGYSGRYDVGFVVEEATLDSRSVDALLPAMRLALVSSIHEVVLEAPSGAGLGISGTVTSNDFHLAATLMDDGARTMTRMFTGYSGTGEQDGSIPMVRATRDLRSLLDRAAFQSSSLRADDMRYLAARRKATFEQRPRGWVHDSFEAMRKLAEAGIAASAAPKH